MTPEQPGTDDDLTVPVPQEAAGSGVPESVSTTPATNAAASDSFDEPAVPATPADDAPVPTTTPSQAPAAATPPPPRIDAPEAPDAPDAPDAPESPESPESPAVTEHEAVVAAEPPAMTPPEPEPDIEADPQPKPDPDPEPDLEADPEPDLEADPEPDPAPEPDLAAQDAPGVTAVPGPLRRRVRIVLALIIVLLVIATVVVGLRLRAADARAEAREQGKDAAVAAATEVLSFDYRRIDQDIAEAKKQATGDFRKQYDASTAELAQQATTGKAVVIATVQASSVIEGDRDRVRVLLFVDQVTTRIGLKTPRLEQNRVRMTMKHVDGAWLVSGLDVL